MAYFYLYKLSRGTSYRTTQLGVHLENCNNLIDQLVSQELQYRLVKNSSFCIDNNISGPEIIGALGLHTYYQELL